MWNVERNANTIAMHLIPAARERQTDTPETGRMSITSFLYRLARFSADARAVERAVDTGSPEPIVRRAANKIWGRNVISKLWWKR